MISNNQEKSVGTAKLTGRAFKKPRLIFSVVQ